MAFARIKTPAEKKKATEKLHNTLNFIKNNVNISMTSFGYATVALAENYWIEKLDPKHREREYLWLNLGQWKQSDSPLNFFQWLDQNELKKSIAEGSVAYYSTAESRIQYQIQFDKGQILDSKAIAIDTTLFSGKKQGFAAYVINEAGEMFIAPHVKGKLQHSSFMAGDKVICAGMIKIENGKIIEINNHSGHYKSKLSNLLVGVEFIPDDVFADNGKVVYSKSNDTPKIQALALSEKWLTRKIARSLQSPRKKMEGDKQAFQWYAKKVLIEADNKPITAVDAKGNRIAITLYETLLAKCIIENPHTWAPIILKFNFAILEKIKDYTTVPDIAFILKKYLREIPEEIIGSGDLLSKIENFLTKNSTADGLSQAIIFHKIFCEEIIPHIKLDEQTRAIIDIRYQEYRSDNQFSKQARGRQTVRSQKWMPLKSHELGILSPKESQTVDDVKEYFSYKQGKHEPGKSYFQFKGKRDPVQFSLVARKNYDEKLTYAEQVEKYNIPFISGPSGTAAIILPVLEALLELSVEDRKAYIMALAATEVAKGHHSMFEVAAVAGCTQYNYDFYKDQLLTDELLASAAYKKFRVAYNDKFDAMIVSMGMLLTRESKAVVTAKDSKAVVVDKVPQDVTRERLAATFNNCKTELAQAKTLAELHRIIKIWASMALGYQVTKQKSDSWGKYFGRTLSKGFFSATNGNMQSENISKLLTFICDNNGDLGYIASNVAKEIESLLSVSKSHTVVTQLVELIKGYDSARSALLESRPQRKQF